MSLSQDAYEIIRRKIITLEFAPGDILDEHHLQEETGLGRTPVREALQRLALEQLVNIIPRRGMYVTEISITDLRELFEVRLPMEELAAELAAQRGTEKQFAEMRKTLTMLTDENIPDHDTLIKVDETFHHLVYKAAHNKFLHHAITPLLGLGIRLWYLALPQIGGLQQAVYEHKDILDALEARDGKEAARLLRDHVETFQENIQAAMIA
jgi:DNA-binding GntR family transcriptional regulator